METETYRRNMKYNSGRFEIGNDPQGRTPDHLMYSPDVKWVQDHESLLRDSIRQWKGSPVDIELHLRSLIAGKPAPDSGTGKISRARAEALLKHVQDNSKPAPTLYRGSSIPPEDDPSMLLGWTSNKKVAQAFAKKYNGKVHTLENAKGVETASIPGVWGMGESEWIVLHKYPHMNFKEWLLTEDPNDVIIGRSHLKGCPKTQSTPNCALVRGRLGSTFLGLS